LLNVKVRQDMGGTTINLGRRVPVENTGLFSVQLNLQDRLFFICRIRRQAARTGRTTARRDFRAIRAALARSQIEFRGAAKAGRLTRNTS